MVFILLDGYSEIGSHVRSNLCLRHLIRSRAVTNFFSPKRPTFIYACATYSELPSNISSMGPSLILIEMIGMIGRASLNRSFALNSVLPMVILFDG